MIYPKLVPRKHGYRSRKYGMKSFKSYFINEICQPHYILSSTFFLILNRSNAAQMYVVFFDEFELNIKTKNTV